MMMEDTHENLLKYPQVVPPIILQLHQNGNEIDVLERNLLTIRLLKNLFLNPCLLRFEKNLYDYLLYHNSLILISPQLNNK
jgi:hypothetical protein